MVSTQIVPGRAICCRRTLLRTLAVQTRSTSPMTFSFAKQVRVPGEDVSFAAIITRPAQTTTVLNNCGAAPIMEHQTDGRHKGSIARCGDCLFRAKSRKDAASSLRPVSSCVVRLASCESRPAAELPVASFQFSVFSVTRPASRFPHSVVDRWGQEW